MNKRFKKLFFITVLNIAIGKWKYLFGTVLDLLIPEYKTQR